MLGVSDFMFRKLFIYIYVCVCVYVYVATEGLLKDQEQNYHLGDFLTGWMRMHGIPGTDYALLFPFHSMIFPQRAIVYHKYPEGLTGGNCQLE